MGVTIRALIFALGDALATAEIFARLLDAGGPGSARSAISQALRQSPR
jgi:hypothetical protein